MTFKIFSLEKLQLIKFLATELKYGRYIVWLRSAPALERSNFGALRLKNCPMKLKFGIAINQSSLPRDLKIGIKGQSLGRREGVFKMLVVWVFSIQSYI